MDNKHGYPFVGVFRCTLLTPEFINWVNNSLITSTGYKKIFEVGQVFWGLSNSLEFREDLLSYYLQTFGIQATKIAMVNFYQNKWSGRYWAEIDGQEVKPDEDDRFLSYSSNTEKSFN